ncbi:hypothetical protein NECAME_14002 [Necator americanus]|uniref:Uncharacterized protein n=1 Tax=Necator americanus TaxID=51031 RepID=W2ST42_NECAM|nr:hypothetical protein NECAME_14002 [Necator americanus]ETN72026.1 hypothetical protein NECAME_14002 [Necator americanus]
MSYKLKLSCYHHRCWFNNGKKNTHCQAFITSLEMSKDDDPDSSAHGAPITPLSTVCRLFTTPYDPLPCKPTEPMRLTFNHYRRNKDDTKQIEEAQPPESAAKEELPSELMFTDIPTSGHLLRRRLMEHRRTLMEDEKTYERNKDDTKQIEEAQPPESAAKEELSSELFQRCIIVRYEHHIWMHLESANRPHMANTTLDCLMKSKCLM